MPWCCVALELATIAPPRPVTTASRISGGTSGAAGTAGADGAAGADGGTAGAAPEKGAATTDPGSGTTQRPPAHAATPSHAASSRAPGHRDPATSQPAAASSQQAPQATSANDATAPDATAATTPQSPAKGAAPARSKALKSGSATQPTTSSADAAPAAAAGTPGLNFMQTLARSLNAGATSATAGGGAEAAGAPAATAAQTGAAAGEPGANLPDLSQALASQSLVASLGLAPGLTPVPAAGTQAPTAPPPRADSNAEVAGTDAVSLSSASTVADLVQALTQGIAADLKDKAAGPLAAAGPLTADATEVANLPLAADPAAPADPSAQMANMGIAAHFSIPHPQADSNTVSADLRATVGTPAWNDELGGQLTWMASQGLQSASLHLSPDHLGPLEVHISVQNGNASVWFGATQLDTRAALEQALPRLRQMFASQGLTLADSGVSREPPRNRSRSAAADPRISAVGGTELPAASATRLSVGLLDTYA